MGGISGTCAIMTISAISLERYKYISNPLSPRLTMKQASFQVICIWIYSGILATPPLFNILNKYVPEGYLISCSFDYLSKDLYSRIYIFIFTIGAYVLPLIVIVYCYIGIMMAVRKSHTYSNENVDMKMCTSTSKNKEEQLMKDMKVARVAFSLILTWFLSWTPYVAVAFIAIFDLKHLTPTISMIPALFAKTSSVISPLIFAFLHPNFKKELKKMILDKRENSSGSAATTRKGSLRKISCVNGGTLEKVNSIVEISKELSPRFFRKKSKSSRVKKMRFLRRVRVAKVIYFS